MYVNQLGNAFCEVLVSYISAKKGDATFRTKLTLIRNGYDDGKVSLEELKDYPAEDYHLDFNARYQNIEFDGKVKSLIVKGQSSKMGKYEVHLNPIS